MAEYQDIRALLDRVRTRWLTLSVFQATVRAALAAGGVIAIGLLIARWTDGSPRAFAIVALVVVALALAALAWGLFPLRRVPSDKQVARYIEEREPALDDRLATAVDAAAASKSASGASPGLRPPAIPPALIGPMMADAARRARQVEVDAIVPPTVLRRAGFNALAAAMALLIVLFVGRGPAQQAVDAVSLTLLPSRVALEVTPGTTRIKAGTPLSIRARLVGNRAPVLAQLQIADGDRWRASEMSTDAPGLFRLDLNTISSSFKYRIVAGAVTSPAFDVTVVHPPRVVRIDVDYTYPAGLRLPPRTETDAGDICAPAGTDVRVRVFTDRPAASGQMTIVDGKPLALTSDQPTELSASLTVSADLSYRIALADREGMSNPGETEYFIRTLEDRAPDVRVLKPATDRGVTKLEEVDVEAQAEDDYGIDRMDLVYAVRGGAEHVVPLEIPRQRTLVTARHTLYLEDLNVQPGDFISYYVRARDITRGTRPNEARSDIFFLEVKPYEQEFALAQSQGAGQGGSRGSIDDLVAAQKEVVVATWKLDRRAQVAKGAQSEQDVRSVSRAEAELRTRVEQTSSSFRESTMRDPRKRPQPQRGRPGQPPAPPTPELKAGQTLPEEDDMTAAADAMGKAVASLDDLKTSVALPPEMDALNHLLKAQADVKRREVMRQQSGSGAANNRSNYDMSSLFDKELQKAQQTNYENKSSAESKDEAAESALDKIKDLARRQDELLKKQQELARERAGVSEEELKRRLEELTREQSELRQKAEELARQMSKGQEGRDGQEGQQGKGQEGQKGQQGQRGQQGQQGQAGQQGQSGQSGQSSGGGQQSSAGSQQSSSQQSSGQGQSGSSGDNSKRMRDVSEEMRNAASDLRREDPAQASARGSRALQQLRQLQQQLESARPDEKRRALGETQLEARQLADAQRQIASELGKTAGGDAAQDAIRKLAGEQERLADRARKLQESLKQQASSAASSSPAPTSRASGRGAAAGGTDPAQTQAAAGAAAKDLEQQRLADRMQQSADAMRAAAGEPRGARGTTAPRTSDDARAQAAAEQELARALDKVADRLASATAGQDGESRKLSDQLARAQDLKEKLDAAGRTLDAMSRQSGQRAGDGRQAGAGGSGAELGRLRDEYQRQLQQTQELVDEMRRDDRNFGRGGGAGATFTAPGNMTLSAPGTEAFKQDFAKWDEMRKQATQALERVESSLSKKLQDKQSKDRLVTGADDKAPAAYQQQVDSYFKAIAGKKQP